MLAVYQALLAAQPSAAAREALSVMVVTFYRGQLRELQRTFARAGLQEGSQAGRGLRLVTVDQSQGSEADVVILSCVRKNKNSVVGFLANKNRANVALSRARARLVVVGDVDTVAGGPGTIWSKVARACRMVRGPADFPQLAMEPEEAAAAPNVHDLDAFPDLMMR